MGGQLCCLQPMIPPSTGCQAGPCPMLPLINTSVQVCKDTGECPTGLVCLPPPGPLAGFFSGNACQPPGDGGSAAADGGEGGAASDAPSGG